MQGPLRRGLVTRREFANLLPVNLRTPFWVVFSALTAACGSAAFDPGEDDGWASQSGTAEGISTDGITTGGDVESTGLGEGGADDTSGPGPELPPVCGNRILEAGESCDDGNLNDFDGCPTTCMSAVCGDGFVWTGVEECDDGNSDEADACLSSCVWASCGDGVTQAGIEQCDDANDVESDACTSLCRLATCGDGFVQAGVEACDDKGGTSICDTDCTLAECGDGTLNAAAGEECDDGNASSLDNCYPTCKAPTLLLFTSSEQYASDLGGTAGADAKCQALAKAAKLPGTFKAWLWSYDDNDPDKAFYRSPGKYRRTDHVVVAQNFEQLYDGPLSAPVNVTEAGQEIKSLVQGNKENCWTEGFWTGFRTFDWLGYDGYHCDRWTKNSGTYGGLTEFSSPILGEVNGGYFAIGCGTYCKFPILCVQQAWYPWEPEPG